MQEAAQYAEKIANISVLTGLVDMHTSPEARPLTRVHTVASDLDAAPGKAWTRSGSGNVTISISSRDTVHGIQARIQSLSIVQRADAILRQTTCFRLVSGTVNRRRQTSCMPLRLHENRG